MQSCADETNLHSGSVTELAIASSSYDNLQQDSSRLGLSSGIAYKEIFNSSWPVFQAEFEPEHANGAYDARIYPGQILKLPFMGTVVLQKA